MPLQDVHSLSIPAAICRTELVSLLQVRPEMGQGNFDSMVRLCNRLHTLSQYLPASDNPSHLYTALKVRAASEYRGAKMSTPEKHLAWSFLRQELSADAMYGCSGGLHARKRLKDGVQSLSIAVYLHNADD